MFITDTLIYVQLHKTGGMHINRMLAEVLGGKQQDYHNLPDLNQYPKDQIFIASIRNPWEWYVSLWAYGCDRKGGLYFRTTQPKWSIHGHEFKRRLWDALLSVSREPFRDPTPWQQSYTHADDAIAFRTWLQLMLSNPKTRYDIGEGYAMSPISQFAGLYTHRYIYMFCKDSVKHLHNKNLLTRFNALKDFEQHYNYINYFIRNENLAHDLIQTLQQCNISLTQAQQQIILQANKTNTSSRKHAMDYYYDDQSLALIAEKERLIIEKFNYQAPKLSA